MTEPISRRSAILRILAAFSSVKLFAWEESLDSKVPWPAKLAEIVPGERFGQIYLDMETDDIIRLLGSPCSVTKYEAQKPEKWLPFFAHLNKMTGSTLTLKDAFPLRPAMTYYIYDRFGLTLLFEPDRVVSIFAYTGVQSGYEGIISGTLAADCFSSGAAPLNTLSDVRAMFGNPNNEDSSEYAPIPELRMTYAHGIAFAGRADDDRLARITVIKPVVPRGNDAVSEAIAKLINMKKQEKLG